MEDKEQIKWIDIKPRQSEQDFINYQKYLIKVACASFGVPRCYIAGYKETRWQKIKRKIILSIYKIKQSIKSWIIK